MGLIKENDKICCSIWHLGWWRSLGWLDFKVAGTNDGITALQMDIKITSITEESWRSLKQVSRDAFHILGEMAKSPEPVTRRNQPTSLNVVLEHPDRQNPWSYRTGGKVIRDIIERTGTHKKSTDDDGTIKIAAVDLQCHRHGDWNHQRHHRWTAKSIKYRKSWRLLTLEPSWTFMGTRDGLVHIIWTADYRVAKTTDIVAEGQEVKLWWPDLTNAEKSNCRWNASIKNLAKPSLPNQKKTANEEQAAG